jgi:hypothetical protein
MSAILYSLVNGEVTECRVQPVRVAHMLLNGYVSDPKDLIEDAKIVEEKPAKKDKKKAK